jgi:L-lysine 2,3-aminomutase
MRFRGWKVDWPNHLIGFFSALFGILIAFELDQWRERNNQAEEARNAFGKLKEEILINQAALHEAVNTNLHQLNLLEELLLPNLSGYLIYKGTAANARTINDQLRPIAHIVITDSVSKQITAPVNVMMSSLVRPPLHVSAWESAKATCVINYLEYEKVLAISYLYNTPVIADELEEIRMLLRKADEVTDKAGFEKLVSELRESYHIIQNELANFDTFVSMVQSME